jgi:hypothetical protein
MEEEKSTTLAWHYKADKQQLQNPSYYFWKSK